jgi:hypothetical protein
MEALAQSAELLRRCDTLRARSPRIRAETDEKNRGALAAVREAVMCARGWEPE